MDSMYFKTDEKMPGVRNIGEGPPLPLRNYFIIYFRKTKLLDQNGVEFDFRTGHLVIFQFL